MRLADAALSHRVEPAAGRALALPALLAAMVSFQTGASVAKGLFPALGPLGMASVRAGIAALVMCAVVRPSLARLTWPVLRRLVPYGVALGAMNACFYMSLVRLPLGVAVAIESLGPLLVALAGSRRPADLIVAALVAAGLVLLLGPNAASHAPDPRGVGFALLAGLFWAIYIVAGHRVGRVLPAASGAALGMVVATCVVLPFSLASLGVLVQRPALLAPVGAVAVLSSALPYTLEMAALRRLGMRPFGVTMSLEPAVAALAGAMMLGEHLVARRWAGIACVVVASLASTLAARSDRT